MDNNNNDKYIYGDTFFVILYTFASTVSILLFLQFLNIVIPIFISNNIIKYTYIILLLPIIDIICFYRICLSMIAFETLCISKKPIAIIGEDSVSIYEEEENGYIRIKYKSIKGIRLHVLRRHNKYVEIEVDDYDAYDIYYNPSSNILSKLINKIQQRPPHTKSKNIRLESIYHDTSSSFEEFKNSVIERANKHRRIPIYLKYW